MTPSGPYPGTQTVLRAVALLKTFSDDRPEWGLTELARASGLHKTTTYRLLSALESQGMVTRAAQGEGYRLGPAAVALGGQALRGGGPRGAGGPGAGHAGDGDAGSGGGWRDAHSG